MNAVGVDTVGVDAIIGMNGIIGMNVIIGVNVMSIKV
jgi:hypothetical protein